MSRTPSDFANARVVAIAPKEFTTAMNISMIASMLMM